jgi:hypothetical protein
MTTLTTDDVLEMARQISKTLDTSEEGYRLWTYEALQAFAKLVEAKAAEREREACLKICETELNLWGTYDSDLLDCIKEIRARGEA